MSIEQPCWLTIVFCETMRTLVVEVVFMVCEILKSFIADS